MSCLLWGGVNPTWNVELVKRSNETSFWMVIKRSLEAMRAKILMLFFGLWILYLDCKES